MMWTNIKEKIPEKDGYVLVLIENNVQVAIAMKGTRTNFMRIGGFDCLDNVSHWMYITDVNKCSTKCITSFNDGFKEGVIAAKQNLSNYIETIENELY